MTNLIFSRTCTQYTHTHTRARFSPERMWTRAGRACDRNSIYSPTWRYKFNRKTLTKRDSQLPHFINSDCLAIRIRFPIRIRKTSKTVFCTCSMTHRLWPLLQPLGQTIMKPNQRIRRIICIFFIFVPMPLLLLLCSTIDMNSDSMIRASYEYFNP